MATVAMMEGVHDHAYKQNTAASIACMARSAATAAAADRPPDRQMERTAER
jgi:heme O synthase-like polyprenyltransferase